MKIRLTNAVVVFSHVLFLCFLSSRTHAACTGVTDQAFISAAIDYYLAQGQPTGSIQYLNDGATVEKLYKPYVDTDDFKSLNPSCCKILGLSDSEGSIYSVFEITFYDIYNTVEIKPFVRLTINAGLVVVKDTPDRIPLNSCAKVITELVGE